MSRLPREPLSAEERELADRLARLDGAAAPSAALDARILAAARDAVGGRGPHRARRRPRWPLALGVAATLALAVGIAWQLRPMQDRAPVYSEAPAAASSARGAGGPSMDELPTAAAVQDAAAPEAPAPSPLSAAGADAADDAPSAQSATVRDAARVAGDADREEAAEPQAARQGSAQESANIRFVPPPAPPPPPQPKEPAAAAAESGTAKAAASEVVFDVVPPAAPPAPAAPIADDAATTVPRRAQGEARRAKLLSKPEAEAVDDIEVTGARIERDNAGFSDQALDDQPPATADSPEVQRDWMQRIRELRGTGDIAGARASVAEFKRRYPHYALPDDLRELAPTAP